MDEKKYYLGGLPFSQTLMNAAGTCKTLAEFIKLSNVDDIGLIMVGSSTVEKRDGNPNTTYYTHGNSAINAIGLQNEGYRKYCELMPEFQQLAEIGGKWIGMSIAAIKSMDEYALQAEAFVKKRVHVIEVNLGCPNVWSDGKQHRVLTFDIDAVSKVLHMLQPICVGTVVSLKLSPIADQVYMRELASVIKEFPFISAITTTNTFPNGFGYEGEKPALSNAGYGGVSGDALKYISLGQVKQWHDLLPFVTIIGVGGIRTGKDLLDMQHAGAELFQIGTAFLNEGHGVFGRVCAEAFELTERAAPVS